MLVEAVVSEEVEVVALEEDGVDVEVESEEVDCSGVPVEEG